MKKCLLFILMSVALFSGRCRNRDQGLVPSVPINIVINTLDVAFFDISVPGGWVYITGGSRGIIVYRRSNDEFVAIERHSSYRPEDQCAVVVMDDGVILDDPCSDSQWLIQDGTIVNGPASMPLRTYATSYQEPYLYINN